MSTPLSGNIIHEDWWTKNVIFWVGKHYYTSKCCAHIPAFIFHCKIETIQVIMKQQFWLNFTACLSGVWWLIFSLRSVTIECLKSSARSSSHPWCTRCLSNEHVLSQWCCENMDNCFFCFFLTYVVIWDNACVWVTSFCSGWIIVGKLRKDFTCFSKDTNEILSTGFTHTELL